MLLNQYDSEKNKLFIELAKSLDITKTQYDLAVKSYRHVAEWLASEDSSIAKYSPDILPQGSFLLGTMIKPIMDEDELDVDLVCQLTGKNPLWTQYHLKQKVGDRLKENEVIKKLLDEEKRRCWTLIYNEDRQFHLDILPAIINSNYRSILEKAFYNLDRNTDDLSIRITDNKEENHESESLIENWPKSNPFGYAIWFNECARLGLEKGFINESIQDLPEFTNEKLPLQMAIQVLKRHRDIMFGGDEHKPISIIITTLASQVYKKENSIYETLMNIVFNMRDEIKEKYDPKWKRDIKWVGNPLNNGDENDENFADKWPEVEEKERNFYIWLDKLESDFEEIKNGTAVSNYDILKAIFGSRTVNEAFRQCDYNFINESSSSQAITNPNLLNVSWRMKPIWPLKLMGRVDIHARYKSDKWKTLIPHKPIPKGCSIEFVAKTNIKKPYNVVWQIVNTGEEAKGNLRGEFIYPKIAGSGGLRHQDNSAYKGTHWAECFIIKNGVCVARSNEFLVEIN